MEISFYSCLYSVRYIQLFSYALQVSDVLTVKGLWIILPAGSPAELGVFLTWKGTMLYMSISQVGKFSMLNFVLPFPMNLH